MRDGRIVVFIGIIVVFALIWWSIDYSVRQDDNRRAWIDQCVIDNAPKVFDPQEYCGSLWRQEGRGK